jgi:hypothetical protein
MAATSKLVRIIYRLALALVLLLVVAAFALWMKPPDILRVGTN